MALSANVDTLIRDGQDMLISLAREFVKDDVGSTAIEYALIASLIGMGLVAALTNIGVNLDTFFSDLATQF